MKPIPYRYLTEEARMTRLERKELKAWIAPGGNARHAFALGAAASLRRGGNYATARLVLQICADTRLAQQRQEFEPYKAACDVLPRKAVWIACVGSPREPGYAELWRHNGIQYIIENSPKPDGAGFIWRIRRAHEDDGAWARRVRETAR